MALIRDGLRRASSDAATAAPAARWGWENEVISSIQVGLVTASVLQARGATQILCRPASLWSRGAADVLQQDPRHANKPDRECFKPWCTVWCITRCNQPLEPLQHSRSERQRPLHGMQGVSGSNPLGSILKSLSPSGFWARRFFCVGAWKPKWAQKWAHFWTDHGPCGTRQKKAGHGGT